MHATRLLSTLLAAAAPLSPVLAQQLIVVDDDGGPGVDHTSIQAAIDVAGPDDAILVKDGSYGSFSISGKSVAISGDAGAVVQVAGTVVVSSITAEQRVLLSGLDVVYDALPLWLVACAGPVVIEDSSFETADLPWFGGIAVGWILYCDAVALTSVLFRAPDSPGGSDALVVEESSVHLYECLVDGGTLGLMFEGAAGLRAVDSAVFASGSILRGGAGGDGTAFPPTFICSDGAVGGVGLAAEGSTSVELLDTALEGGAGGLSTSPACVDGSPGAPSSADPGASITHLPGLFPARQVVVPDVMRAGESGTYDFEGSPGELVWAIFGTSVSPLFLPAAMGTLVSGGPWILVFGGVLGAGGTSSVPFTVTSSLGSDFTLVYTQGLFLSLADGVALGTPRVCWLVGAGF